MTVGRYHSYSEYKESCIAWVGKVPNHWQPVRFKHVLLEKKKTSNPNLEAGSISFGNVIFKNSDNLSAETKDSYQEVLSGEFLINPLNLNYDLLSLRTALSEINVVVSTGYIVLLSTDRLIKKYTRWLLQQFDVAHMKTLGSGVRQTINYSDIGNSFFFEPSQDEQTKIANFLDHETAKIDTLIDKQQQLIKLLKEKRQAVISHAVTKGLNSAAPMKNSGVEWLGEVPEHWVVAKLRYLVDESAAGPYGASLTKAMYTTSGYRVYGQQQVIAGSFELGDYYISKEKYAEMERYTVYPDDVLISVMGTVGKVVVVPENVEPGIINPRLVRYVFNKKRVLPEFVKIQISSSFHQDYLLKAAQGSTMDGLNMGILGGMSLAFPKAQEQQQILDHVNKVSDKFSRLISFSEKSLELLQERRTALISAAVTGKIDVRNWQPAG